MRRDFRFNIVEEIGVIPDETFSLEDLIFVDVDSRALENIYMRELIRKLTDRPLVYVIYVCKPEFPWQTLRATTIRLFVGCN